MQSYTYVHVSESCEAPSADRKLPVSIRKREQGYVEGSQGGGAKGARGRSIKGAWYRRAGLGFLLPCAYTMLLCVAPPSGCIWVGWRAGAQIEIGSLNWREWSLCMAH